ncbi:response regulator [Massilia antarctica]|uniref:Response regulator n=1 Tax=Massilia antarctica TaxID=2765360 RepID=A0AA49A6X5_9BURK|nr:response regulator [Massilia antarctica]QPI48873.1 response regulator [Massilia antarctica]
MDSLLDVMMAGRDGLDLARALRPHPGTRHVPIIFATAEVDDANRLRGLEPGAVDYVVDCAYRPVNPIMGFAMKGATGGVRGPEHG